MTKLTEKELDKLAVIVRKCYKDGTLTQREINNLAKVADCIQVGNMNLLKKRRIPRIENLA